MPDERDPRSIIEAAEQAAAAGDYTSAERLLREAAELQEATLGPLHPDVANTLNNLGVVCEITSQPVEAERCFRRAYEIAIAALEPDHPFVATSRKNLEDFCAANGRPADVPAPPPRPAVDVRIYEGEPEAAEVAPPRPPARQLQTVAPGIPSTPSRRVTTGTLLVGGAIVTVVAAMMWLRTTDAPDHAREVSGSSGLTTPAATKPVEPGPAEVRPVEPKPVASKPPDVPETSAPARTEAPAQARPTSDAAPKPAPVVVDVQLCRDLRTGGPATSGWRCDPATSPVAPGRLLFYTRLNSPTATTVQHRWYRGDRLRQRVELGIRPNPGSGYRTYSRNTIWESGDWRVELRTRDGVLLHEERFTVR